MRSRATSDDLDINMEGNRRGWQRRPLHGVRYTASATRRPLHGVNAVAADTEALDMHLNVLRPGDTARASRKGLGTGGGRMHTLKKERVVYHYRAPEFIPACRVASAEKRSGGCE